METCQVCLHRCAIGFACSHGAWAAAAAGCNQVYLGRDVQRAIVCRSPLPDVGQPAMLVVRVQG